MNITLIGMAGAGKSTVGKVLAARIGYGFVDIDDLLRDRFGRELHMVIDEIGDDGFMVAEREEVLSLDQLGNTVISPGGSVIYSADAMAHLKNISKLIFLDTPFEVIEKRVDIVTRGLVGMGNKSLRELYDERRPLYFKHADLVIDESGSTPSKIAEHIFSSITIEVRLQ